MHGRIGILGIACLSLLGGCSEARLPAPPESKEQETALAQSFDPATAGTIRGRIVWDGDAPAPEETLVRAIAYSPTFYKNPAQFVTPHVPTVHPKHRGVGNAVVYLRGIDPRRSKKWDHANVRVEFHERQLLGQQGKQPTGLGFVRRGSAIEIVNRDTEYHNLHGRGAAFFAMPLIDANQIHERTLSQVGIVDLSCGAGYYWLHAHLFVAEHPYYTRTDADGNFALEQVPAGKYEVVCWLPSWHVLRKEVDPETGIIARLAWAEPQEQVRPVQVLAGQTSKFTYRWTRAMFADVGK
jgi:hypothetical protein